jgi:hypothetical protein
VGANGLFNATLWKPEAARNSYSPAARLAAANIIALAIMPKAKYRRLRPLAC